uniref:Connector enhancer of kinase suppressor of Ras 1 n=1 Tax=Apteryx owenii TaxID=8824 RepID=A0A8B9PTR9_APTOW
MRSRCWDLGAPTSPRLLEGADFWAGKFCPGSPCIAGFPGKHRSCLTPSPSRSGCFAGCRDASAEELHGGSLGGGRGLPGAGPGLSAGGRCRLQVGWTPANLAKKLLEKPSGATLVLKKIPLSLAGSPRAARQPVSDPSAPRTAPAPGGRQGCSELGSSHLKAPGGGGVIPERDALAGPPQIPPNAAWPRSGAEDSPGAPGQLPPIPGKVSPLPLPPTGVATRLSRRRVSCRDLGRVDCDGWLLKKKDHVGFMAQKWKRCWFVLKGHTLYWYNHPNDEKAAGLINVATYDLESTREQKKKYVFQLSHETYKPFIFAAETLADLSMWVSHLITAKTKYTLAHQSVPHREEDCYSETEAEDPDDDSPKHGCDSVSGQLCGCSGLSPCCGAPSRRLDSSGEDLESLMQCLKQGGVSLIGRQRFLTEEQYRKSFIKRNKNPLINEKVHLVRALQSTLKAKLTELQVLEQLLSDAALTSEKFTSWKEEHQDLYQELREWWVRQQDQDLDVGLSAEPSPMQEVPLENSNQCPLHILPVKAMYFSLNKA